MAERILAYGYEGIGWGAISAGCDAFFGYPITPQNEVPEWFSREFPKRGKVFVQSQSETATMNMLLGAGAVGGRVMTSTSSPGWSLMLESMSHCVNAGIPCVVVDVQRGGPGTGHTSHAQMDYTSATRGGGHGGYKTIVLAPASVQENCELVQHAFYLADKYRNPVVVLGDAIILQMREMLEVETIEFPALPDKDWAVRGKTQNKGGQRNIIATAHGMAPMKEYPHNLAFLEGLSKKFQAMAESGTRYESYRAEDADLVLIAYGYVARVCKEAVNRARSKGIKAGLIRPITLWPFPNEIIRGKAAQGCKLLVVEDSLGQMVDDVEVAVKGQSDIHFLGALARHLPTPLGAILPNRVLQEVEKLVQREG